jgi:hypothetical protein
MDFVVLFLLIFLIILILIRSNTVLKPNDTVTPSKCSKTKFKPKIIQPVYKTAPLFQSNKVYDDLSLAPSSNGSKVSSSTKDISIVPVHRKNDYFFIGNPQETQVYHIFNNAYTKDEASEECAKRSSRLAHPDELKNAYDNGAEWCSWGWASDGHAYMPNNNKKCNKSTGLISGKNIENKLRLGANCYGIPK